MKIKAVLFDLDGTLLNTLDDIADSANYALSAAGCPPHPVSAYRYFVGQGVDNLVKRAAPEAGRTPERLAAIKKIYLERYSKHSMDKTRPYCGVPAMVGELKKIPVKLAVISNKPERDTKATITITFSPELFDLVTGGRDGVPLKPNPAAVYDILDEFGVSPAETMFIGDTAVDMETAGNAGCVFVGVTWGFRPEEISAARDGGAGFVIDSPSELIDLVRLHE
ncbi:MAG: HAD-IA family hydrolase [Synergistaceae bacterium]|jgi:phosphoglycolate phosphatase|nr:HAD-IA family hydrolase [Synergistaceae bacterium]